MNASLAISATTPAATLAALADVTILTESLQLAESITHKWLKTESEKPTPPAPTELQPAIQSLWRFSVIRKNLISLTSTPANPNKLSSTSTRASHAAPEPPSEAAILRSLEAVPVTKLIEFMTRRVAQHTKTEIAAIKARRDSNAAADPQIDWSKASQVAPQPAPQPALPAALRTAQQAASEPEPQSAPQVTSHVASSLMDFDPQSIPDTKLKNNSRQAPDRQTPNPNSVSTPQCVSRSTPRAAHSSLPPKFRYPPPKRTSV